MKIILAFILCAYPLYALDWPSAVASFSKRNLRLEDERLRVEMANQSITYSKLSLLPKLNLFKVVNVMNGGLYGLLEDLVPFLIPSNWARVTESKYLAEATKLSYESLWVSQLGQVKMSYLTLLTEEELLKQLALNLADLKELEKKAALRQSLGMDDELMADYLKAVILQQESDRETLARQIMDEKEKLAQALGLSSLETLEEIPLESVPYPAPYNLDEALLQSSELKTYDALAMAASAADREIYFNFLGGASIARGFDHGIFEGVPYDNAFGLATPIQLSISKKNQEKLKIQRELIAQTIRFQWKQAVGQLQLLQSKIESNKLLFSSTKKRLEKLKIQFSVGKPVSFPEVSDLLNTQSKVTANQFLYQTELRLHYTKLEQLMRENEFRNPN